MSPTLHGPAVVEWRERPAVPTIRGTGCPLQRWLGMCAGVRKDREGDPLMPLCSPVVVNVDLPMTLKQPRRIACGRALENPFVLKVACGQVLRSPFVLQVIASGPAMMNVDVLMFTYGPKLKDPLVQRFGQRIAYGPVLPQLFARRLAYGLFGRNQVVMTSADGPGLARPRVQRIACGLFLKHPFVSDQECKLERMV